MLLFGLLALLAAAADSETTGMAVPLNIPHHDASHCQMFTHYNALCTYQGVAYMITSRPCLTQYDFLVTVVDPINDAYATYKVHKEKTFVVVKKTRVEISVVFLNDGEFAGDSKVYIYFYKVGNETADHFYEEYFFTAFNGPDLCTNLLNGPTTYPTLNCKKIFQLDYYGSACYYKVSDGVYGLYVSTFDPCELPYNISVAAFVPALNVTVVKYFEKPTTSIVPVYASTHCGFALDYGDRMNSDGKQKRVVVYEECPGKEKARRAMIEAHYQPDHALLCHPSHDHPHSSTQHVVIASLVILAVILCILGVIALYFYQRRKARGRGDGLPYHMEVNTFDDED